MVKVVIFSVELGIQLSTMLFDEDTWNNEDPSNNTSSLFGNDNWHNGNGNSNSSFEFDRW